MIDQVGRFAAQCLCQHLACMRDAQYVVPVAPHYRKPGMPAGLKPLQVGFQAFVGVEIHHFATRHHQRCDLPVIQAEYVAHHLVLIVFDDACVRSFFQHQMQLFFCHGVTARILDTEQAQRHLGGSREQLHEWLDQRGKQQHGAGDQPCQLFRTDLSKPLGHQFPQHDGKIRDGDDHQAGGKIVRRKIRRPQRLQP